MLFYRTINVLRKLPNNVQCSMRFCSFAIESNMEVVLKNISSILSCSKPSAFAAYKKYPRLRSVTALSNMKQNIELLTNDGVSKKMIVDNPFLLTMDIDVLRRRLEVIKQMQPRHIEDFVPLLDMRRLSDVAMIMAREYNTIPEKNRIYYLSRELKIAPVTVSKYCSKFNIIFFDSFANIAKKLKILLDYNVDGEQILHSLYIFGCGDKVFISRLEKLSSKGLFDIKPWFFKLTDTQFRKVLASEAKYAQGMELAHEMKGRNSEKLTIMSELNAMLSCDNILSVEIYYNFIDNIEKLSLAKQNVDLLTKNGVSLELIQNNPVVLTLPNAQIIDNIKLIKKMNPDIIEDFLPLVEVDTPKLMAFARKVNTSKLDSHPIYFFSKKLNIAPDIVSKYFAEHKSFLVNFVGIKPKLNLLLAHNVEPMSILKSPNTFYRSFKMLEETLKDFKAKGIEDIMSWMLVCDKSRMKAFAARRAEEKKTFGETTNTVDYVAKRLNWDPAAKEKAIKFYPPLVKCSVLKVKAHLDYLLNETHFTIEDINANPSVFRTNLDELKTRINELAAIGLVPRKLYSICSSRMRYLKMVAEFCKNKNCPATFESFKSIEKRIKE